MEGMREYLEPKGVEVQAVLIRDIRLPPFIVKAIEAKKEREQEVEKQRAELERLRTDPAAKVYFLNGDSPTPLPLMHLGEDPRPGRP
jgi:hypothetical protein